MCIQRRQTFIIYKPKWAETTQARRTTEARAWVWRKSLPKESCRWCNLALRISNCRASASTILQNVLFKDFFFATSSIDGARAVHCGRWTFPLTGEIFELHSPHVVHGRMSLHSIPFTFDMCVCLRCACCCLCCYLFAIICSYSLAPSPNRIRLGKWFGDRETQRRWKYHCCKMKTMALAAFTRKLFFFLRFVCKQIYLSSTE